jgi:L-ascorbate metabolism protein UlaG (beta-lactamase superfamily)
MKAEVTLIGNEGFRIAAGSADVFIDAFNRAVPCGAWPARADVILVTHSHWDHFDADSVAEAASRTGATVVGPRNIIKRLDGRTGRSPLVELEPPLAGPTGMAKSERIQIGAVTVTAFRTFHSRDHNSYLVETPFFRFFHDGDNEDTRRIDAPALGRLDALLIAPWQGSGWVEFIEKLAPTRWFIMHLSDEELDAHEAGQFLPDLCGHVPAGLVALRPGGTFVYE